MTVTESNIIGFLHKDYILNKTNFTLLDPNGTQLFSYSKSSTLKSRNVKNGESSNESIKNNIFYVIQNKFMKFFLIIFHNIHD